ncbi:MAG: flagellar hook-associated protein FlgL [Planctomycetaceae bacterium]|nr:flagellar hook-associated protein FlgL [Planctomycetaceae bacterium]
MINRISQAQITKSAVSHLAGQTAEMFKRQQEISTGLRIQKPSDDPSGMRRSLIQKDRIERLDAHISSIQFAQSRLSQAAVQLQDANALLVRAQGIALQSQQTTDQSEVNVLVSELNGILDQLVSVANASDENGYLFSGTASQTLPFPDAAANNLESVYAGAPANTQLLITGDVARDALLPGDMVFQSIAREATILQGTTGARPGTGTDTATGTRELQIVHGTTTYWGGSGVSAGSGSEAGDTIIGPVGTNHLQVNDLSGDGSSGTFSLNGGPEVTFTSADTNLLVTGPKGEKVYLDASAIVAGFSGSIDITSTGTMSIDGGVTTTPLTFAANEVVTDSRNGAMVNLNTSTISRTGTDQVEFPGTTDVFNAVRSLRDDLLNTRNLSTSDRAAALDRRLGDLERVHAHILDIIGVQSVSMEQIDRLQNRTEDLQLSGKIQYSDTVSADVTESVTRLQELTNLQQFTMAAVSQLMTPNLLNYIN